MTNIARAFRTRACAVVLATLAAATSCTEGDTLYCKFPARFVVDNIYSVPQLYTACNSMGQFCTIRAVNQQYIFSDSKGSTPVNQTALGNYSGFYMGLSGFIVGLPYIPEMGHDFSQVVCFDLACPNCYQDFNITKRMTLQADGTVRCGSCSRTYDLNNQGLVSSGEPGRRLYRYRVSYISNTLVISNM